MKMRCFIAIDLSDEARDEIAKLQKNFSEADMKLVEPPNLHMTIQFLGELTDFQVNQCRELLKNIKFPKFSAHLGNAGVFPSESYIKIAWVSLEPQEVIKELHEKIHSSLKGVIALDERFESHITLARIKFIKDKRQFIEKIKNRKFKQVEFAVDSFALKKSTLTGQGPIYEDIWRTELS